MRPYIILIIILLVLVYPSFCKEVAYALGPDGEKPLGQANITDYKGTDVVFFTVSAAPRGPSTSYKAQRTVDDIKEEINKKVDKGNELVRDEGLRLVGKRSGAQRIDQICSIYDYMVGNWTFVSDWSGLDVFQYSNYTLRKGNEVGTSGKGDCDDFSILLASLIESIGGTPRIIFAYSPTGGHAYTEVYLGKSNSKEAERMLRWLRSTYGANEVNVHVDPGNDDVWLNMDWWKDAGGAKHPGGPFYKATAQIPVYSQENSKAPLTAIENLLPIALFRYDPFQPEVEKNVRFDASQSFDPDGKIIDYEWDFGDGGTYHDALKSACPHIYMSNGNYRVNLTVIDNEDGRSSKVIEVTVVEPIPEAVFTYSPLEPKVGEVITFDASQSNPRIGQITEYNWNFDDGYSGQRAIIKHSFYDSGTYNVTLTVTNDKGTRDSFSKNVIINQKSDTTINPAQPTPSPQSSGEDWINKGLGLGSEGKNAEALEAFDMALQIDPGLVRAWYNRGYALNNLGRYDEAIKSFDKAIEIGPQYANIWQGKGAALEAVGRMAEANEAYAMANKLQYDPLGPIPAP
jgi:PKD repeat protein